MEKTEFAIVFVTAPTAEAAAEIARTLVTERLCACVNIVSGVRSIYFWENSIEDSPEVLMIIKTVSAKLAALKSRVEELHPYTVPEFLAVNPVDGLEPYLNWVRSSCE